MEAVPRLPMISFDLKTSVERASFNQPLKQYIAQFYGEDPESYNNEIHNLESLRCGAVAATADIEDLQILKKYYCQLCFLKSRFPMEEGQPAAVYFCWKDRYLNLTYGMSDIRFELMCVLYNIGALHTELGTVEQRTTPDGMKIACTHFQCAAWAFQMVRQKYYQMVASTTPIEVVSFMELVCLAQAQECILEKSMMDNRKATIIAKVAVEVVNYYRKAQVTLQGGVDETNYSDFVQVRFIKEWVKYLNFKIAYHKCISLLFQGQQAEEQQKMGERVALYQAAAEQLEAARKLANSLENKQDINEALAFTSDVVEGKKKAAKNENDFIYHEGIPNMDTFPEVKGASLVKGIPFSINDVEVSGSDIFARLVPMEAHEASSLYSEKKAEVLRKYGEMIENKDQKLAEFLSSMQIDTLNEMRQATGLPQDIVDRAAALSAKTNAIQDLISLMTKLSNSYQEVESLLEEIQELLKTEEQVEREYQMSIGERPPSIIATDLSREAAKYREAHNKANDSNQNLHRAMLTHVGNLKTLSQPLTVLQQEIPSVKIPDPNIDEAALQEIELLLGKVEEMKTQRGVLWAQLRDALHKDDIISVLVTKQAEQSIEELFEQELAKHQQLTTLIEQNTAAQENIIKAFIDAYAKFSNTRRHLQSVITKRKSTINALISSFDTYEDLFSKVTKGVEFYSKLETNVTKLLQRIKSSCKVQQEERDQMLSKNSIYKEPDVPRLESNTPKLKDYLDSMKNNPAVTTSSQIYPPPIGMGNMHSSDGQVWPPGVRPTPVGSEIKDAPIAKYDSNAYPSMNSQVDAGYYVPNKHSYLMNPSEKFNQYGAGSQISKTTPNSMLNTIQSQMSPNNPNINEDYVLEKRLNALMVNDQISTSSVPYQQYNVQDYGNYNYAPALNNTLKADESMKQARATYSQVAPGPGPQVSDKELGYSKESQMAYGTHTQYVPNHYQHMNFLFNNQVIPSYGPSTSNHIYASGYATTQNYQNSALSTVQSGGNMAYSSSLASQKESLNMYSGGYGMHGNESQNIQTNNIESINQKPELPQNNQYGTTSAYSTNMPQEHQTTSSMGQLPGMLPQANTYGYGISSLGTNYQNNSSFQSVDSQVAAFPSGEKFPNFSMGTDVPQNSSTNNYPTNPYMPVQNYSQNQTNNQFYGTQNLNTDTVSQESSYAFGKPPVLSQYSEGYVGAGSLIGQNPINPSYMYTQAGMSFDYNPNNTMSSTGGLTSPQCLNESNTEDYSRNYSYVSNSTPYRTEAPQVSQAEKKSSTIDLLAGLDFNISQIPLEPEQKKDEVKIKKDESTLDTTNSHSTVPLESNQDAATITKHDTHPVKTIEKKIISKPMDNEYVQKLFHNEIDKFEKFVDVLGNKTLNGLTNLDLKWKEIQEKQDSEGTKRIISVARCYPMKNRFPDILPYDHSRVVLRTTVDDYINASFIKDISAFVPPLIITQSPLQSTMLEFWTMVLEQRVNFVLCLLSDSEIGEVYWPCEREKPVRVSNMIISLQSAITKKYWIERVITINIPDKREFSTIVHLQFIDWHGSLLPASPEPFVTYIREFINLYHQQSLNSSHVVVHCSSGIGRSGVACLLIFAILEVTNNATSLPDLISLTNKITSFRKNILRDREHLKFAYQAFLIYMKQLLSKDSNLPKTIDSAAKEEDVVSSSIKNDPLSSLDPFWASRKDKA